jgi:serine/threonine-protein phosphatase 2A activator
MIKMYNAEVLSKFPVVQHFPFGSLFNWDQDPSAPLPQSSAHASNQPPSYAVSVTGDAAGVVSCRPAPLEVNRATSASKPSDPGISRTSAPWAKSTSAVPSSGFPPTRAPWAVPGKTSAAVQEAPWASATRTLPNTQK